MTYYKKSDKGWVINKISLFLLLTINIFLLSSLVLNWYTSHEIKDNFNNFSNQVKDELKTFSEIAKKVETELGSIQKEIRGLTKTIEELNVIEKELKNVTTNLAGLNKVGEELKETGENIKGSLDDLGELKEKIDELTKLEIPLIELEKSLIKGGEGLEKEIKEKIGGLIGTINDFKKIVCPQCFDWNNFQISYFASISNNNVIEVEKWKTLFEEGKLIILGKVETVKYAWGWLNRFRLNRKVLKEPEEVVITIEKKNEVKQWRDEAENKVDGEERKEFLFQEAHCKGCGRKLNLKDFSIKKLKDEN